MIQWVHLGVQVRNGEDFDSLRKLLDALGMKGRGVDDYKTCRVESFLPSVAALEVVQRGSSNDQSFLELTISDPDSAVEIARNLGLEIINDHSGSESTNLSRTFGIRLPGGATVNVTGFRTTRSGAPFDPLAIQGNLSATGLKFAIVVSRFNSFIVERLLLGALDCLRRSHPRRNKKIRRHYLPRVPAARRHRPLRRDRERSYARHWPIGAGDQRPACVWRSDLRYA